MEIFVASEFEIFTSGTKDYSILLTLSTLDFWSASVYFI